MHDVQQTLSQLKPVAYDEPLAVSKDVSVVFHEAGHILGSAMLELNINHLGNSCRVIFSGDIGQWDKPLIHDPTVFDRADYVVMESTYGNRDHQDGGDIETQMARVITSTVARGGNVIIPTFAVERAQELMYYIGRLVRDDRIPRVPVYLDSPMAVNVTEIFRQHRDRYDEETWRMINAGAAPLSYPGLHLTRSVEDSKQINALKEPAIIMATSGMCTAGRIKHHLRRNISCEESTVLFVGYQAHGTLGHRIRNREDEVRIHGRKYVIRAQVAEIFGFSGHADRGDLLKWVKHLESLPRRLFLTHGDEEAALELRRQIEQLGPWNVEIPQYLDEVELGVRG